MHPDLPDGNSKYTTFEVDTRTKNRPTVRIETCKLSSTHFACPKKLMPSSSSKDIDGEKAWQYVPFPLPSFLLNVQTYHLVTAQPFSDGSYTSLQSLLVG